ncbi:MAG: hypothetical protein KI790_02075 [Cyclobacteriaceae bacterium]|nr:hypothetical protein [Cyclobacteriaceae bacterium HetDA_MAG_MS6]
MNYLIESGAKKAVLLLATQIAINLFSQYVFQISDYVVVGNILGSSAMAVLGVSFPFIIIITVLLNGLVLGYTSHLNSYIGSGQPRNSSAVIVSVIHVVIGLYGLFFASSIFFDHILLSWLNCPQELLDAANSYLMTYASLSVVPFFFGSFGFIIQSYGRVRDAILINIFSGILNVLLDIYFLYVLKTGLEGAVYASVISQSLVFSLALFSYRKKNITKLVARGITIFYQKFFVEGLKVGIPISIQNVVVISASAALHAVLNQFSTEVIAAFATVNKIELFVMLPSMAFGQALFIFIGHNKPTQSASKRIVTAIYFSLLASLIPTILMSLLLVNHSYEVIEFFFDKSILDVVPIIDHYYSIVGAFYCLYTVMFLSDFVLKAYSKVYVPLIVTIVALWLVRLPLAYHLSTIYQESGIWISISTGWIVSSIILVVLCTFQVRKIYTEVLRMVK